MTSILIIANVKRTSSSSSSSSSSGTVLTKLSRSKWMLASRVNSEWMAASLLGDNCSATTSVSSKRLLRWESRLWFWGGRTWGKFLLKKVYLKNPNFHEGESLNCATFAAVHRSHRGRTMSGQSGHQIVIRRRLPFCDPHSSHVDRGTVCESQYSLFCPWWLWYFWVGRYDEVLWSWFASTIVKLWNCKIVKITINCLGIKILARRPVQGCLKPLFQDQYYFHKYM